MSVRMALFTATSALLVILMGCGGDDETPLIPTPDNSMFMDNVPGTSPEQGSGATSFTSIPTKDYDVDDDNLIEILYLEQLNAIRYDLNGDGLPDDQTAYFQSFPGGRPGMGCIDAKGCIGYELMTDLDFSSPSSYLTGAINEEWRLAITQGWRPIGSASYLYNAKFEGNDHIVRGLRIRQTSQEPTGLWGSLASNAELSNLWLADVVIEGGNRTGGLVGRNDGLVQGVHVDGIVTGQSEVGGLVGLNGVSGRVRNVSFEGSAWGWDNVGGLVGRNDNGWVDSSFSIGTVSGRLNVGGIAGMNSGEIHLVHATVAVNGAATVGGMIGHNTGLLRSAHVRGRTQALPLGHVGGVVGWNDLAGRVKTVYSLVELSGEGPTQRRGAVIGLNDGEADKAVWDVRVTQMSNAVGEPPENNDGMEGYDTGELRSTLDYIGPFIGWDPDVDGDGTPDDEWDFRSIEEYPALKADFDGDGQATPEEFGNQK